MKPQKMHKKKCWLFFYKGVVSAIKIRALFLCIVCKKWKKTGKIEI